MAEQQWIVARDLSHVVCIQDSIEIVKRRWAWFGLPQSFERDVGDTFGPVSASKDCTKLR